MKGMKTLFCDHKHTQKNIEINVLNENIKKVFAIYICVCVCVCVRVRARACACVCVLKDGCPCYQTAPIYINFFFQNNL